MPVTRPNDKMVAFASGALLQPQTEVAIDEGDCCVVVHRGQVAGGMGPGRWMLQQYPCCAQLLADGGRDGQLAYVLTRQPPPLKLGGRVAAGDGRFFGEAVVVVRDPMALVRQVLATGDADVEAWLTAVLVQALSGAIDGTRELARQLASLHQAVGQAVEGTLTPAGVALQDLRNIKLAQPAAAADPPAAAGGGGLMDFVKKGTSELSPDAASKKDRLELLGTIAGKVRTDSPDPNVRKFEEFGLFVAADPLAIRHYSGIRPGWRWLARGGGDLMDQVGGWPLAPNGDTSDYFASEEQARAYYAALRQHAFASVPSLQPEDTRQKMGLNAPSAYSETLWNHGHEALYLLYDHMEDMQALGHETDAIGIFPAGPPNPHAPSPPIITYKTKSDILYLAAGRGASGAAEHVVIVLSGSHEPRPMITDGLPRAEWMSKFEQAGLQFAGNILVVQWGRFSGAEVLAGEDPNDPVASLKAKLGDELALPIQPHHEAAARLGDVPAAYAVRMEPGSYSLNYYELGTYEHGTFFFCAISRDGAESFMPLSVGDAGGRILGGLDIEQYAMMTVERDDLMMRLGPQAIHSQEMATLCNKYGVENTADGNAGKVFEWEHYIAGDSAFSAQWAMQLGIARMRLQGHQPDEQQMAAIAQQQHMVQQSLDQSASRMDDIRDAAIQIIRSAANRSPEEVTGMVQQWYPHFTVEEVLHKTLRILRDPDDFGRFDNIEACVEPLARAHYRSMSPEDQRFEGSEDKFFREERSVVYSAYDIEVPGFFNKLFG